LPGAIHETSLEIGEVELGKAGTIGFIHGRLKVGHPMSPPLIRAVKKRIPAGAIAFVDCPPGTACPAVTAITGCDYAILVTEPTPFGLHDLTLAVATVRVLGVPFGVVVNRMGIGDSRVHHYCAEQQIPVLLEIPDDRRIAEGYARGHMIPESAPELRTRFMNLLETVTETGPAPNSKGACRT
jgi:MinD superfamily P-loop ATPase